MAVLPRSPQASSKARKSAAGILRDQTGQLTERRPLAGTRVRELKPGGVEQAQYTNSVCAPQETVRG